MKEITPGAIVATSLLLVSCHSFSTFRDSTDAANGMRQVSIDSNRVSGLVYYLPKGRIRITGDFKSASGDGGDAAAKSGSPAGAKLLAGAPSSPSGGDSAEQKNFVVTIAADIEADPKARYYLKPVRNYFTMMTSSSALTRSICSVRETRLPKTKLRRSFQQLPA